MVPLYTTEKAVKNLSKQSDYDNKSICYNTGYSNL